MLGVRQRCLGEDSTIDIRSSPTVFSSTCRGDADPSVRMVTLGQDEETCIGIAVELAEVCEMSAEGFQNLPGRTVPKTQPNHFGRVPV
jgi:hypothetical protein